MPVRDSPPHRLGNSMDARMAGRPVVNKGMIEALRSGLEPTERAVQAKGPDGTVGFHAGRRAAAALAAAADAEMRPPSDPGAPASWRLAPYRSLQLSRARARQQKQQHNSHFRRNSQQVIRYHNQVYDLHTLPKSVRMRFGRILFWRFLKQKHVCAYFGALHCA